MNKSITECWPQRSLTPQTEGTESLSADKSEIIKIESTEIEASKNKRVSSSTEAKRKKSSITD